MQYLLNKEPTLNNLEVSTVLSMRKSNQSSQMLE
jgi:hypothetical protein